MILHYYCPNCQAIGEVEIPEEFFEEIKEHCHSITTCVCGFNITYNDVFDEKISEEE
jgi:hypothetical protein